MEILAGPRDIPPDIIQEITTRLDNGMPLVSPPEFDEFVETSLDESPKANLHEAIENTARRVVKLGSTSVYMAHMLAADMWVSSAHGPKRTSPRARRLSEHNQSVTNVYESTFAHDLDQDRDGILRVYLTALQDIAKTYCTAREGDSKNQKTYHLAFLGNILPHVETLSSDQKEVIELLTLNDMIGSAMRRYQDKGQPFEEVMADAEAKMDDLRRRFPDIYKDRVEQYVDVVFRADAGAHTQHPAAQYVDMATGQIMPDVTDEDRKRTNSKGLPLTLDRLFSETPEDHGKLRLHRPKDLEVVRRLLPSIYPGAGE
jgi:hypothetical protein